MSSKETLKKMDLLFLFSFVYKEMLPCSLSGVGMLQKLEWMPFFLPLKLYGIYSEEEILTTTLINVKRQTRTDRMNIFFKVMPFVLSAFAGCELTSADIAMAVSAVLVLYSAGWSWAQSISCLLGPRTARTPRSDTLCSPGSCCNEFHPNYCFSFFTQWRALWMILWFLEVILWETDMMFPSS